LKGLAFVLLIAGLAMCALAASAALGHQDYYTTARALERQPYNMLYQAEYNAALMRQVAYVLMAVICGLGGVIGSAVLFGLAAVLQRLDRARAVTAP
jgi:hypothetical protein